jgi:hypothetical protein
MKTRANMPLEDHVITGRFPVAGHFLKKAIGRLALQNIRPLNPRPAKIILLENWRFHYDFQIFPSKIGHS